ncbi:MAG: alpha-amylase family glycosyl hydrolase, partial [Planctomycetota bacterium]
EEDVEKLNKYLIDSDGQVMYETLIDFPERRVMENVFAKNTAGPAALRAMHERKQRVLAKHALGRMVRCLDNHDMPRFLTVSAKTQADAARRLGRLKLGITYLLTTNGVPIVYYGTEQAFQGGGRTWDESREDMFDGEFEFGPSLGSNFDTNHEMFQFSKALLKLRRENPALAIGEMRWLSAENRPGLLAYLREDRSSKILVVMNTDENGKREISLGELSLGEESKIRSATAISSSRLSDHNTITIPPQGIGIYHITR